MTSTTSTTSKATRSQGEQGKATSRKPRAPKVQPVDLVKQARDTFGTSKQALGGLEAAATAYEAAQANILGWVKVAQAVEGKVPAREFATLSGGDPNTLGRLLDTGALLAASRKGKGTRALTVREAVKQANAKSRAAIAKVCAEMLSGSDPLGTHKVAGGTGHRDGVQASKGKRAARNGKVTTVKPAEFVDTLGVILANLHRCSADSLVEIARLGAEISEAATREAASKRKVA